ncbi:MAG: response regulator [Magnetococcales bacterium]|nr:response regulator [Magnetococcales bacterium]
MATILMVDDDDNCRMLLGEALRHAGHVVVEAENGKIGLEIFNQHTIDLIITDIFMPVMDGIDLLAAVLSERPGSKVIAISGGGKAMNAGLILGMAQSFGAIEMISKPFHLVSVLRRIEAVLQR